jgi:hypothetical protein
MPQREPGPTVSRAIVPRGRSTGDPLSASARGFFEPRFGHDLSSVRVHTDGAAQRSARALRARAYTVGSDIFFGAGRYDPEGSSGRELLAHELTHVLQQAAGREAVQREGEPEQARARTSAPRRPSSTCPQGKQSKATTGDCSRSGPADPKNFISGLDVSISGRTVTPTWTGTPRGVGAGPWVCTPNPKRTPTTPKGTTDHIGVKCGINHTNHHRDGMAWFSGIERHGYRIGFHDSKPIGTSYVSHGCIRVYCDVARTINENTSSGVTKVNIA